MHTDRGTVFNIQKFSINDGPGIRTTVFLKGCPLHCLWCHNPESQKSSAELSYDTDRCVSCLRCVPLCPNGAQTFSGSKHILLRENCIACMKCTQTECSALEAIGRIYSVGDVMNEVMADKCFYDHSNGGMTLSGGEPFMQADFTVELLKAAKEKGLHTCVETCGFTSYQNLRKAADYCDIFLWDVKETNEENHRRYTGVSSETILANLRRLDDDGFHTILRCPIIPGFNDRSEHFKAIADIANSLKNVMEINVEPYHPLGASKSAHIGREYPLGDIGFPDSDTINNWISAIQSYTQFKVCQP